MTAGPKGVRRLPPPSSRRRPRRSPPLAGLCRPPLLLTMLLGGLWHGASWNFVLWGGLHGTYLTIERILRGEGKVAPASLDQAARLAQGYLDLRVGERDLGLLPIAVARGHPHGLAEAAAPRQRRTRVVVCPRGASGARDGPGGIRRPAVGMAVPHRGDVEPAAPGRLGTRGLPRVLLRRPGQLALHLLPVLKRGETRTRRIPPRARSS